MEHGFCVNRTETTEGKCDEDQETVAAKTGCELNCGKLFSCGSRRATEYLISLGHRKIACLSGPLTWECSSLRRRGWRQALEKQKLPLGPAVEGEWSAEGGFAAARRLLNSRRKFSAVVAANDQIALGAIKACSQAGLSVPEDISVIGFDNMAESKFFSPSLTTVDNDFDLLGETCLQEIVQAIANPKTQKRHHKIAPKLVIRESVSRISTTSVTSKRRRTNSLSCSRSL
jgi:DNA-binding LacI/PurR family transcriptional regulator